MFYSLAFSSVTAGLAIVRHGLAMASSVRSFADSQ